MSTNPWRRWSADEIYNREHEQNGAAEEQHLMFFFSPSSSQRFLTPNTSNLHTVLTAFADEVISLFSNKILTKLFVGDCYLLNIT